MRKNRVSQLAVFREIVTISRCFFWPRVIIPLLLLLFFLPNGPMNFAQAASQVAKGSEQRISREYGSLPLSFEQNHGQAESQVRFLSRGASYSILLKESEADFLLSSHSRGLDLPDSGGVRRKVKPQIEQETTDRLRMQFLAAQADAHVSGEDPLPGTVNYFTGSDPAQWHVGISTFARVRYNNVYPGIDLVYYGARGRQPTVADRYR
jgi:hypothetical protein